MAALLVGLALVGACASRAEPPVVPADLLGDHGIASDPLSYYYQEDPHTEREIRARRAFSRKAEAIRFSLAADGTIRVRDAAGVEHTGELTRATTKADAWVVDVRWETPPTGAIFGADRLTFSRTENSYMLKSTGVEPGATPDDWFQVAPLEWCWEVDHAGLRGQPVEVAPPTTQPAEPWAERPSAAWPQLVLTNHVEFRDGRGMDGASSFLVEGGGRVVLATALHLIGPAGGVDPAVPLARLEGELERWVAYVRTRPRAALVTRGVAMTSTDEGVVNDWLFLPTDAGAPRPAQPLRLRDTPVAVGERVWLVGCEYRDEPCTQRVYGARVSGRRSSSFRYDLDEPVVIPGFSGAPILDTRGLVVGVMSVGFTPFQVGDAYLEAGGQDASAARALLPTGG